MPRRLSSPTLPYRAETSVTVLPCGYTMQENQTNEALVTQFAWFHAGQPVADVYARSADAQFILDCDFEEDYGVEVSALHWKECLVPVSAFALRHTTLEAHLATQRCIDPAYERERLANVRAWIGTKRNAMEALHESPLLVSILDGELKLQDGWHRLGIAAFEHGLTDVLALCVDLGKGLKPASHYTKQA